MLNNLSLQKCFTRFTFLSNPISKLIKSSVTSFIYMSSYTILVVFENFIVSKFFRIYTPNTIAFITPKSFFSFIVSDTLGCGTLVILYLLV